MDIIKTVIDFILHIDAHLGEIISNYGMLTYIILFGIIFIETGVVIMPFLPGDSLIFAAAAFAGSGSLNIIIVFLVSLIAAVLGDTVNFEIGKFFERKKLENVRFIKKEYLEKTQSFFDKHGGKSIVIARFIPIIRTFAPFVAGIGKMKYSHFITYNFLGAFLWVTTFTMIGYFFGNIPFIQKHFSFVVIGIIFLSVIPVVITFIRNMLNKRKIMVSNQNFFYQRI